MTRQVPPLLQAHLDQAATTTTRLLKITLRTGFTYGLSMLDADVVYDDGTGSLVYTATNGFDASTFSSDLGFSVANAEAFALISDAVPGVTLEMVEAGEFDDAQWVCYLVNFRDLAQGHVILDAGDLGEVRARFGMIWMPELLSYIMRLRQPVGSVWSRRCRAIFGSPADSQTGCGVDLAPLWVNGEVVSVGAETNRLFEGDEVTADSPPGFVPMPGFVQFLTGANAGREFAVEEIDGEEVTLSEPTNYAIEIGDTYRIRPDCGKLYEQNCIGQWNNGPNFKGEPLIPVGDAVSAQAPGAQLSRGGGFIGEASETTEDSP
jgi:uncharacterized phage protein (TIGR02218 family)